MGSMRPFVPSNGVCLGIKRWETEKHTARILIWPLQAVVELGSRLWKAGSILPRALWFSFRAEVATGSKSCEVEEMAHRQQQPMLASEITVAWPGLSSGLTLCKVENCLSPKMLIWP